jgi:hypothetical protein
VRRGAGIATGAVAKPLLELEALVERFQAIGIRGLQREIGRARAAARNRSSP